MPPERSVLDSGASVVSESMPGVESVSLGLYFPTGSRHETQLDNGVSHFIEHLVFKGTPLSLHSSMRHQSRGETNRFLARLRMKCSSTSVK